MPPEYPPTGPSPMPYPAPYLIASVIVQTAPSKRFGGRGIRDRIAGTDPFLVSCPGTDPRGVGNCPGWRCHLGVALVGGTSGGLRDFVVGVAGLMDALPFSGEVVVPVLVEVAVAVDGSEFEDGFCAVESPAGAGDVHAVLDEVAAGAFDDSGGDRPAAREGGRVVQVGPFVGQVGGGGVGAGASAAVEAGCGGLAADGAGDAGGPAGQDRGGVAAHPVFGGGVALGVETPGCFPLGGPRGEVPAGGRVLFRAASRRTTRAGFPARGSPVIYAAVTAVAEDTQHRLGALHFANLPVLLVSDHLCPFAPWTAFPSSLVSAVTGGADVGAGDRRWRR